MCEGRFRMSSVILGGQLALTLALASAHCAAEGYVDYYAIGGEALQEIQTGEFAEHPTDTLVASTAEARTVAEVPIAGATVSSVTALGNGRYSITGVALDQYGNPACALALASGNCMFTCGPGSLMCEGGTADLPFGEFELTDLPTEANGSIVLQVFVQGHVSYTMPITVDPTSDPVDPTSDPQWGAINFLCCDGSASTLLVTIDGVTKCSKLASCSSEPTWEGWVTTSLGSKAVDAVQQSVGGICPTLNFSFTTQDFLEDRCYIFASTLSDSSGDPVILESPVDCAILP